MVQGGHACMRPLGHGLRFDCGCVHATADRNVAKGSHAAPCSQYLLQYDGLAICKCVFGVDTLRTLSADAGETLLRSLLLALVPLLIVHLLTSTLVRLIWWTLLEPTWLRTLQRDNLLQRLSVDGPAAAAASLFSTRSLKEYTPPGLGFHDVDTLPAPPNMCSHRGLACAGSIVGLVLLILWLNVFDWWTCGQSACALAVGLCAGLAEALWWQM